jgi:hypothetical protein
MWRLSESNMSMMALIGITSPLSMNPLIAVHLQLDLVNLIYDSFSLAQSGRQHYTRSCTIPM